MEQGVDDALRLLLSGDEPLTVSAVEELVRSGQALPRATAIEVAPVDLAAYDALLTRSEPGTAREAA